MKVKKGQKQIRLATNNKTAAYKRWYVLDSIFSES